MKVTVGKVKALLATAALGGALAAFASPALADSSGVQDGCLVAKAGSLCTDANGNLNYSSGRAGSFTSSQGYFQYTGYGPFTISWTGGHVKCAARSACQLFYPEILVPVDTTVIVTTRKNGSVFAGTLPAVGGD